MTRFLSLFGKKESVPYDVVEKAGLLKLMKKYLTNGSVELETVIKQQARAKTIVKYRMFHLIKIIFKHN